MYQKKTIVVIDDDLSIRTMLHRILEKMGFKVHSAEGLLEGSHLISGHSTDLILCDLNLNGESGLSLITTISNDYPELPIITISATCLVEESVEAFRAGAWDFITKPFSLTNLKCCIDKSLARAENLKNKIVYKNNLENKLDQSYIELKRSYEMVEGQVEERTAELAIANEHFMKEAEQRRKDEIILKDREARFKALFNSINSGVVVCAYDTKLNKFIILDVNKSGQKLLGINLQQVINQPVLNIFPICEGTQIVDTLQEVNSTGIKKHSPYIEAEEEHIICWHENGVYKLPTGELVILFDDETLRRKAENEVVISKARLEVLNEKISSNQIQLIQSEKMASIGQLAAGVAHEINNPVGFITSNLGTLTEYVELFKSLIKLYDKIDSVIPKNISNDVSEIQAQIIQLKREEDITFVLEDIDTLLAESKDGATRVKEIVQNLKSFARLDEDERKYGNINDGIEATLKIVWNELKYKCEVQKELGDIPDILCNPGQLNQVFMNLFVNASHAIEKEGVITITTEHDENNITIKVFDTGKGIEPGHLTKLFDPFFTTKPEGVGTGLGLSISHGIITDHNGTIEVESELEKGTCFTVKLPIHEKDVIND